MNQTVMWLFPGSVPAASPPDGLYGHLWIDCTHGSPYDREPQAVLPLWDGVFGCVDFRRWNGQAEPHATPCASIRDQCAAMELHNSPPCIKANAEISRCTGESRRVVKAIKDVLQVGGGKERPWIGHAEFPSSVSGGFQRHLYVPTLRIGLHSGVKYLAEQRADSHVVSVNLQRCRCDDVDAVPGGGGLGCLDSLLHDLSQIADETVEHECPGIEASDVQKLCDKLLQT